MEIRQYDIVLVDLDPTRGAEIKKVRPCVIMSPDEMNRHLQTVVICPVTSTSKAYPTRVPLSSLKTAGWLVLDQIRTIDRLRVINHLGTLTAEEIARTKAVLKETYVD